METVRIPEAASAAAILEVVRATSVSLKRSLSENELIYIYQDYREGTSPTPAHKVN